MCRVGEGGLDMVALLVVDEQVNTRLLYKDEFEEEGYEVSVAETTEEAMEKIHQSAPDIITLDLKIPGTQGIEFLRKVKEESGIPVVLCSAYAGYKNDSRVGMCDAFVVQSADFTELKMIVHLILNHGQSDLISEFLHRTKVSPRRGVTAGTPFTLEKVWIADCNG